jgi:hypothetical protein
MTVRDIASNIYLQRVERAKNQLDACANKLRQHRLANTNAGYLKAGIDVDRFRRDEEIFSADYSSAQTEINQALIAYSADIKSRQNGHSQLQQQGTLYSGPRR